MDMPDPLSNLRIAFYFEPRAGQPNAPDGPGFYLAALRDSGVIGSPRHEIVPRVRIPNGEMLQIAKVLDKFVDGKPLNWSVGFERDDISLEQAALETIEMGKLILAQEIEQAERAAANLARLRQIQEEFDE